MRNGTYPLMFIGRVSNIRRNGTYLILFIVTYLTLMRYVPFLITVHR